jgi:hypothetical protein
MDRIVELDVGGKLFKTSVLTLSMKTGYFHTMLESEFWKESFNHGQPIFLDRGNVFFRQDLFLIDINNHVLDPDVFAAILSYLRSGTFHTGDDHSFLARIQDEGILSDFGVITTHCPYA